ncbi:hypothetical protein Pelo_91 [Pelomyxa schiedti]|nr:hypothetical protein Pelo_91 [Pelomyxa schiedti]
MAAMYPGPDPTVVSLVVVPVGYAPVVSLPSSLAPSLLPPSCYATTPTATSASASASASSYPPSLLVAPPAMQSAAYPSLPLLSSAAATTVYIATPAPPFSFSSSSSSASSSQVSASVSPSLVSKLESLLFLGTAGTVAAVSIAGTPASTSTSASSMSTDGDGETWPVLNAATSEMMARSSASKFGVFGGDESANASTMIPLWDAETIPSPDEAVALVKKPLKKVWKTDLKIGAYFGRVTLYLSVDTCTLYAGCNGELFALNPFNGAILWHSRPKGTGMGRGITIVPIKPDKLIYAGGGCVTCVSCHRGSTLWSTSLPSTYWWSVTILVKYSVVYAGAHSKVFALDLTDGSIIWSYSLSSVTMLFPVSLSWHKDNLIVGSLGCLYNINPNTGEAIRKTSIPGSGYNIVPLISDEGRLYYGTLGKAHCCAAFTHSVAWKNPLTGMGYSNGATYLLIGIGIKRLIVAFGGKISCMDASNGSLIWFKSLPGCGYSFVTVTFHKNFLWVGTWGKLYCMTPETGEIVLIDELTGFGHQSILFATTETPYTDFSSCTIHGHNDATRQANKQMN